MDQAQARALLAGERARLQRLLQAETGEPQAAELGDDVDDADRRNTEQSGMAVDQLLRARWAALVRAEVGLVSAGHPFAVLADADITPEEEQASEEDDDEPPPEPSLGIHIEPHNQAR
jgi:hypothetical protein